MIGKPSQIDFKKYRKNFAGAPHDVVERTFESTTQMGRLGAVNGLKLWKRHKAPNPALNVTRRNQAVATDTIYGPGCPAVDNVGGISVDPYGAGVRSMVSLSQC